jgi:TonB-linked SusC/RagA family outer membrane protein
MYSFYKQKAGTLFWKLHKLLIINYLEKINPVIRRRIIMRINFTTLILIAGMLHVSASSIAQKINLSEKNAPLIKVFDKIRSQTGYDFLVSTSMLKDAKPVNINVRNAELQDVLTKIFNYQNLNFKITDKSVVVFKKEMPAGTSAANKAYTTDMGISFRGQVVNAQTKEVLPGVSISVLGSKIGTASDNDGYFTLKGVTETSIFIIQSIGFNKTEIPFAAIENIAGQETLLIGGTKVSNFDKGYLRFELSPATTTLDETQIIAYGKTSQRYNTGSVATISSVEIEQQPVTNVLQALEGRVPGLTITQTNGAPGAATLTQIRGQNSLSNNPTLPGALQASSFNQPLYIIDGVPIATQNTNTTTPSLAGAPGAGYFRYFGGLSPLNSINPNDIESISVLKDADATSIYGSQGSNGVILITTKKGKSGKEQFDISLNSGPTSASRTAEMMNTAQYLAMRNEADKNGDHTANITQDPDLTLYDQLKYTDWVKQFYGGTGHHTDLHLSLSGGSENTNYLISGGETHETYDFPGDFADNRLSLHTSFSHKSSDKKFTVDFGTDYSYDYNNSTGSLNAGSAFTLAPNTPNLTDGNGNLIWDYKGYSFDNLPQGGTNPSAYLQQLANTGTSNLNTHMQLAYQLLPSLKLAVNAGYNRITIENFSGTPIASENPADGYLGTAGFGNNYTETINIEPQLNFSKTIGKGSLNILVGGTYRKNRGEGTSIFGYNYSNDALLHSISGAGGISASDNDAIYKYIAGFARINYVWDGKYILNLTGNRNGSSNFGPEKRFGNFGSAGAGWILTEERFLQKLLPFLSFAKISGNYGTSGSDGIQPYQYQPNWQPVSTFGGYQGVIGYNPVNPLNPTYAWSVDKKFNESLELGFLKNRLYLNFTAYQNKSSDQLVDYTEPITTGFSSITANAPYTVENKGTEISITSKNIVGKDFQWSSSFNISHNANKITKFPDLASSPYANQYVLGRSTSSIPLIPFVGVDPATGLFQYRKADGTVAYNPNNTSGFNNVGGDETKLIDLAPKYIGGLNNTFVYKGFSLSVFFQFSKQMGQNYLYPVYSAAYGGIPGVALVNEPAALLSRWQKPGDISQIQRLTAGRYSTLDRQAITAANVFDNSTGAYSDASYIRLKNVSFAYSLPKSALKKLFIQGCTFYINAQNLFLITGYKVGDPETQSIYSIPPQRTIVAGLNLDI